jgi:hypothetical protein
MVTLPTMVKPTVVKQLVRLWDLARIWVQLSRESGVVSTVTKRNPSCSHVDWC